MRQASAHTYRETFHKVYCREDDGGLDEGCRWNAKMGSGRNADRQQPEGENGRQVEREDGKPFFVIPAIPAQVPPVRHMRWAAFLRKCPPDEAVRILKDLKLDNDTINRVRRWYHGRITGWGRISIPSTAMSRMEPDRSMICWISGCVWRRWNRKEIRRARAFSAYGNACG